jgi:hypothetical protein
VLGRTRRHRLVDRIVGDGIVIFIYTHEAVKSNSKMCDPERLDYGQDHQALDNIIRRVLPMRFERSYVKV